MKATKQAVEKFYPLLRWLVSLVSLGFFIYQLSNLNGALFLKVSDVLVNYWVGFLVVVALALVNWNGEAFKLRILLRSVVNLNQWRAFLIVLGGMAVSNFTPARTGEYIGRSLLLRGIHPVKVVIATVTGNLGQVLFTYGVGLLGLFVFLPLTGWSSDLVQDEIRLFAPIAFLVAILVLVFYGRRGASAILKRLPRKVQQVLGIVKEYNQAVFGKVVLAAGTRYAAFSIQFFLLLQVFSGFALPTEAILLIPVAYLLQTLVPVPAISDVGVRVAVSSLLFGHIVPEESVVLAVTCLWFLNLILPGLLGTFYLVYANFKNK